MSRNLFLDSIERAEEFAQNMWLSHLLYETIENLAEYEKKHKIALKSDDKEAIMQTKLQIDATIASLQLASHVYETQEGS